MPAQPSIIKPPYPRNVPLLKGALVSVDRTNPQEKVTVPFQYNPEKLTRTLKPRTYGGTEDPENRERYTGAPEQSISCQVRVEAVGNTVAGEGGVLAYLAALELFLYPKSTEIESYAQDANSCKRQAVPPLMPRTLFVWGPRRVLPVQLTTFKVTETIFNDRLSPIAADVDLTMTLYPFTELKGPDYQLQLTYLKNLEKLRDRRAGMVLSSNGLKTTGAAY